MDTIRIDSANTRMIAHRGLSGLERENTYPAFVAAGNRSYFGIETDVHKTADGEFVIIHDETTTRVSGGKYSINVEENGYNAISEIVLPDLDGSTTRNDIRIPLLADYIKICKKYEKVCVLELKNAFETEDIEKIVEIIKGENYLENVIFISFVLENCINLRPLVPNNDIQFLTEEKVTDELIDLLVEHKFNLDISYKRLTKEVVDRLHSQGILVNCWTVNEKADGEALSGMGVDFITTNILE